MNQPSENNLNSWSVIIIDMFHYMDPEEGEYEVTGFTCPEDAIEYARRRVWSSVEECRPSASSAADLKSRWFMFGEDCIVPRSGYNTSTELDYFVAHPATREQIDWVSLEPNRETRELLLRARQESGT